MIELEPIELQTSRWDEITVGCTVKNGKRLIRITKRLVTGVPHGLILDGLDIESGEAVWFGVSSDSGKNGGGP